MRRVARYGDGWLPAGIPVEPMGQMMAAIRRMAAEAGRNPDALELVPLGNVELHDRPIDGARMIFTGSLEQIVEDVVAVRGLGATELILNLQFSPGVGNPTDLFEVTERLWAAVAGA
jgi:alkanesulfonate monooxygenase SsuD/methylene tetrahydromethanopterin reductase-like flavin-dependent oxidoreductase (luciferase family)